MRYVPKCHVCWPICFYVWCNYLILVLRELNVVCDISMLSFYQVVLTIWISVQKQCWSNKSVALDSHSYPLCLLIHTTDLNPGNHFDKNGKE